MASYSTKSLIFSLICVGEALDVVRVTVLADLAVRSKDFFIRVALSEVFLELIIYSFNFVCKSTSSFLI